MNPIQDNMKLLLWTLTACATLATPAVQAGNVLQAQLSGQPLMNTKEGNIEGCGVRIVGISEAALRTEPVRVADVSFNVFSPGVGMIKGGMKVTTLAEVLEQRGAATKTKTVPIKGLWLRPMGGVITKLAGGTVSASPATPGSLIYVSGLSETMALFGAVLDKKPIQIGFELPKDMPEVILAGTVAMSEDELAQVSDCISTWAAQPPKAK